LYIERNLRSVCDIILNDTKFNAEKHRKQAEALKMLGKMYQNVKVESSKPFNPFMPKAEETKKS
jgi:hypothetical protein